VSWPTSAAGIAGKRGGVGKAAAAPGAIEAGNDCFEVVRAAENSPVPSGPARAGWKFGGNVMPVLRAFWMSLGVTLAVLVGTRAPATEQPPAMSLVGAWSDGGSSSREARRQAIDSLPLGRMTGPARRTVEQALRETTLYRRLPPQTFACDEALLEFALAHPEAIVDVWRVLGISRLSLDLAGPQQWRLSDGYGTVGSLRLVHRERRGSGGLLVFHGRGGYSGTLAPKPLTGGCLILVQHHPEQPTAAGGERQTVRIDAFLDVDGMGLELVARTLQPLIVRSAAMNLAEVCLFMESLSAAAARNPAGVVRLTERLTGIDPVHRMVFANIARTAGANAGRAADPEAVQTELAARWLPADEGETLRQ